MPLPALNDPQYLEKQYRHTENLDARINLHRRFSVNQYGWHPWVFDHFFLPVDCRILELGCGPGYLWMENIGRIPPGWEITLSDHSNGMVQAARRNLAGKHRFEFKVIDAQSIPCKEHTLDAVIANHMLYHLPDRPMALAEIRRVLKVDGKFFASTVGDRHLMEMGDLIHKYDPALDTWEGFGKTAGSFTLENGAAQLSPWFDILQIHRYEDALEVTDAQALVDYILSGREYIPRGSQARFKAFVSGEIERLGGAIHITKDSGLFECVPRGEER